MCICLVSLLHEEIVTWKTWEGHVIELLVVMWQKMLGFEICRWHVDMLMMGISLWTLGTFNSIRMTKSEMVKLDSRKNLLSYRTSIFLERGWFPVYRNSLRPFAVFFCNILSFPILVGFRFSVLSDLSPVLSGPISIHLSFLSLDFFFVPFSTRIKSTSPCDPLISPFHRWLDSALLSE